MKRFCQEFEPLNTWTVPGSADMFERKTVSSNHDKYLFPTDPVRNLPAGGSGPCLSEGWWTSGDYPPPLET